MKINESMLNVSIVLIVAIVGIFVMTFSASDISKLNVENMDAIGLAISTKTINNGDCTFIATNSEDGKSIAPGESFILTEKIIYTCQNGFDPGNLNFSVMCLASNDYSCGSPSGGSTGVQVYDSNPSLLTKDLTVSASPPNNGYPKLGNYYITFYVRNNDKSINFTFKEIFAVTSIVNVDNDHDGYPSTTDCNDNDATKWQYLTGYIDSDGDGYGNIAQVCSGNSLPSGYMSTSLGMDCNDNFNNGSIGSTIHPGATEICGNGIDEDCSGTDLICPIVYQDLDADGYTSDIDCNDNDVSIYQYVKCYSDSDKDGYTNSSNYTMSCTGGTNNLNVTINGSQYTCNYNRAFDCADKTTTINPGKTETCNSIDDNCNGQIDEGVLKTYYRDSDSDTFGNSSNNITACSAPVGYVTKKTDCDDATASLTTLTNCRVDTDNDNYPTGSSMNLCVVKTANYDTSYAGINYICTYTGYGAGVQYDCNNNNALINHGAIEICGNGVDENCNGKKCDVDNDSYANSTIDNTANLPLGDCKDTSSSINPSKTEIIGNTVDENCNGSLTN